MSNPLKANVNTNKESVNSENINNTADVLTNLFKTNMANINTNFNITDLFQNPNLMMQTLQANCSAVGELFNIANATLSAQDTFTYPLSTDPITGEVTNATASSGFADINPANILNTVMTQTQTTIFETCKLVADKALMINNLSSQLSNIKTALSSGDINQLSKIQEQISKALNDLPIGGNIHG